MTETKLVSSDKIEQLEAMLLQLPQASLPVVHEFCEGVYARTMHIAAGTCLTGAIHREDNFLVIREGDIAIWTDKGMKRFKAGDLINSKAGIKRAGYAFTDTVLTTFHANPTNETEPELLWELFTVGDVSELEFKVNLLIEA
jgi:hypothetical protein